MQRAHSALVFTFFRNAANFPKGLEIKTHTTAYSCICILRGSASGSSRADLRTGV